MRDYDCSTFYNVPGLIAAPPLYEHEASPTPKLSENEDTQIPSGLSSDRQAKTRRGTRMPHFCNTTLEMEFLHTQG